MSLRSNSTRVRRFAAALAFLFVACRKDVNVVHYVKSNLDGSKPALVTMYIAAPDRIEVYKSEKDLTDSADVLAHIDWKRLSADSLDAGVITADGKREPRAKLSIAGSELFVKIGDTEERLRVDTFPLHVYNFDLMSLNVTLPRIARRNENFRIAFAEPTFGEKPGVMELRGFVTARYVGGEPLDRVPTRKYVLSGDGMAGHEGTLWINASDGMMQRFESTLANNPGWTSLRLDRRGTAHMSDGQWREYKRTHVGTGLH
jgi:hypothetical protein